MLEQMRKSGRPVTPQMQKWAETLDRLEAGTEDDGQVCDGCALVLCDLS